MLEPLEELRVNALKELGGINNSKELETWRVRYLGKKSGLTQILRGLASLPLEERKTAGARAN
ncbi:MAG: phenylalanine--tRNA ligase subunit alpha, partial [Chloroflexi bacterium]|nr:phenylalanine--tRNA ligase subunit alpha [Chloroflexota bacterium]